ncbi:DALR anticodon-binding domain-containing protein 3 [Tachyglossus aculeatus]|uniref:DALR anticodon-binding domain-containing protein 3 n=1 Tax=Tachyglossus aculeatus TaxID=9261 RepID=UPI0018F32AED|nr:DALR anticodon-binding domain-containing protein 3 [Tachyglossus aculeatus]
MATGRLGVGETLEALNAALRPRSPRPSRPGRSVWFKESTARNLHSRDFLAPRNALRALFRDGQVPKDVLDLVTALKGPGVLPVQKCIQTQAGVVLQLERPAIFQQVLNTLPRYIRPPAFPSAGGKVVVLDCVPLHSQKKLEALSLNHLRVILVADHLAEVLRTQGIEVRLVPALHDDQIRSFLRQLKVNWPAASAKGSLPPEARAAAKQVLRQGVAALVEQWKLETRGLPTGVLCKIHLKKFLQQQPHLRGYDANLDSCLVREEHLETLVELQEATRPKQSIHPMGPTPKDDCTLIYVVSCEEEFQQQKVDLIWRLLNINAPSEQKYLVCGTVKVTGDSAPPAAFQYHQIRQAQMYEASAQKRARTHLQGEGWKENICVLTAATIKFEMLSTAHRSQITLNLGATSASSKGNRSGTFVMYNCARLATLFENYKRAVERGLYPALPSASEIDFSVLHEEGEWLLLFNDIIPYSEILTQLAKLPVSSPGIRIPISTEAICKFLMQLSTDFSSYYNRIHILREPQPHLFGQMFARLQLLQAVREVFHRALSVLHLPPLNQI